MTATFVLGMILLQSSVVGNSWVCTRGEMLHTSKEGHDNCILCPHGTHMPDETHTNRQCYICTRIENPTLEIEVAKCNGTHDAVIDCICGYYRYTPRIQGGKDECKQCQACPLPGDTSSSGHSPGTKRTTVNGLTEDTEKRTRGAPVPTDTLHSHERNEGNRSQNGVIERHTSVPSGVYEYVILFVTLMAILTAVFVAFVRTDTPDTKYYNSSVACSRFKSSRIVIATVLFVLLFVFLIICALLKTGVIEVHHDASTACVIITVLAAGGYVIFVNFHTRQPHKSQVNEDRRPGTALDGQREEIIRRQTARLIQFKIDFEESVE